MAKEPNAMGRAVPPPLPVSRPRSRWLFRMTLLALLGFSAATAFGYYGWGFYQEAKELRPMRHVNDACAKELHAAKEAGTKLTAQVNACQIEQKAGIARQTGIEAAMTGMQANLSATRDELEGLRKQRADTEQRLKQFQELTAKFRQMIDSGKIAVTVRQGSMLVELPAEVLFPSGSAQLSRPGELAVLEVGIVLKQFPDRRFMVVGHTDDQAVKSAQFTSNWELSTARAVTVTQFLISAGLDPHNVLAAGHGEFDPVASNKTKEGRDKNRRIEIILLPAIDALPELPTAEAPPAPAPPPAAAPAPPK
jgi:chemotaxis protein MotB